jgi:hypothetical protein
MGGVFRLELWRRGRANSVAPGSNLPRLSSVLGHPGLQAAGEVFYVLLHFPSKIVKGGRSLKNSLIGVC